MKEVVAYCRVARAKQSDPSAEAQRQAHMIRRYADARGVIICGTYRERLRGQHSEQGGHSLGVNGESGR